MKNKGKSDKKEVYFIATQYKNGPVKVGYYTTSGEAVPENKIVKKEDSKNGPKYYFCD